MSEVRWHINNKGVAGRCSAEEGKCPLAKDGKPEIHYETAEDARAAFEEKMAAAEFAPVKKKSKDPVKGKPRIPKTRPDSHAGSVSHGGGPIAGHGSSNGYSMGSYSRPYSHGGHGR